MYKKILLASLLAVAGSAALAAPVPYQIDPNHTQVVFTYNHFGFSTITGRLGDVTGDFNFDAADPTRSSVSVSIPIDSISMGVARLDTHLKSPDFFDAAQFPTATFKSSKVEAAGPGKLKVSGDLTIHGVSKPVVLDVTINKIGENPATKTQAAGFNAATVLKRSDFGMGMATPMVGDDVTVNITLEARLPKP